MKCGWQSIEGYTHDGRLIGRGVRNQEPDGNIDIETQDLYRFGRRCGVIPTSCVLMHYIELYVLYGRELSSRGPLPLLIYFEGTMLQVKYPMWYNI
jgi:hypothetical protein